MLQNASIVINNQVLAEQALGQSLIEAVSLCDFEGDQVFSITEDGFCDLKENGYFIAQLNDRNKFVIPEQELTKKEHVARMSIRNPEWAEKYIVFLIEDGRIYDVTD